MFSAQQSSSANRQRPYWVSFFFLILESFKSWHEGTGKAESTYCPQKKMYMPYYIKYPWTNITPATRRNFAYIRSQNIHRLSTPTSTRKPSWPNLLLSSSLLILLFKFQIVNDIASFRGSREFIDKYSEKVDCINRHEVCLFYCIFFFSSGLATSVWFGQNDSWNLSFKVQDRGRSVLHGQVR